MVKVFAVWHSGFHDNDNLVGLFSNRKKAEKCIEGYTPWDRPHLRIEEEVVQ